MNGSSLSYRGLVKQVSPVSTQLFYSRRLWPRQWRITTNVSWPSLTWPKSLIPCGLIAGSSSFLI